MSVAAGASAGLEPGGTGSGDETTAAATDLTIHRWIQVEKKNLIIGKRSQKYIYGKIINANDTQIAICILVDRHTTINSALRQRYNIGGKKNLRYSKFPFVAASAISMAEATLTAY